MNQIRMVFHKCHTSTWGMSVIRLTDIEIIMNAHGLQKEWNSYLLLKTLPILKDGEIGVPEYRLTCFLAQHGIQYEVA